MQSIAQQAVSKNTWSLDAQNCSKSELKQLNALWQSFSSSVVNESSLKDFVELYRVNGYINAHWDTIVQDSIKQFVLKPEQQLKVNYLLLERTEKKGEFYKLNTTEQILHPKAIKTWSKKVLEDYEENGYPFATLNLSDWKTDQKGYTELYWTVRPGPKIDIDSIVMESPDKLPVSFIVNYLGVRKGTLYSESRIKAINARMKDLSFIQSIQDYQIRFDSTGAVIYLYLKRKKSSQFDFLAGVLPDQSRPGQVLLTGEARLKLVNALNKGEQIETNWKSPAPRSQNLVVNLSYPYLFNLPVGVAYQLNLNKRDTLFLNVFQQIGIDYLFSGGNYLRFAYQSKSSNILSTNLSASQLQSFNATSSDQYGISTLWQNLNNRLTPTKGWRLEGSVFIGNKEIQENEDLGISASKIRQIEYKLDIQKYTLVGNRNVFVLAAYLEGIKGKTLFQNELLRFGGLRSLRGFDEESIFASEYSVLTAEYRFMLEQNTYFNVFFQQSYYNNQVTKINDNPIGFGAGINFETRLGIFAFNYALGRQQNNPIYFRSAKVHFGIISYF